jgi:hypothetical protein
MQAVIRLGRLTIDRQWRRLMVDDLRIDDEPRQVLVVVVYDADLNRRFVNEDAQMPAYKLDRPVGRGTVAVAHRH